jgi:protein SCO1/2
VLPPRIRLALTVAVLCAAVMVVIVILASPNGGNTGATPVKTGQFYGATLPPTFPAVNFSLPDQNHRTIRLSAYSGEVVAATFVYSTCQNTCPIIVQQLSQAINELPHPIAALAISVDPRQDTPTNVKNFLVKEQVLNQLHYLVARRSVLAPIWKQFGIRPQLKVNSGKSDHSVDLVLFDKAGRARVGYEDLSTMDPDAIAADIRTLQSEPVPAHPPARKDL